MPTKKQFPNKIGQAKATVSYEEMVASNNTAQTIVAEVPQGAIHEGEFEDDELLLKETSAVLDEAPPIDLSKFIPRDELDSYLDKKWNERLQSLQEKESQKEPVHTRKVESEDDLPEFKNWEVKDRIYVLCTGYSSLSQGIKDRHKKNSPLMYQGRSLRYSTSQASFFMDKQVGEVLTTYLSIENGKLFIPKENTHLQKFLAIHPDKEVVFKEFDPKQESKTEYDQQKIRVDAHILERSLDTPTLVAVAMLMCKGYSETSDLFTIKRDLYNEIEANPKLFIKLANDRSLKLKSTGRIALYRGYITYDDYRFYDENSNLICEVRRNENEYDALAAYFSSSEGRTFYEYLHQKIES